MQPLPWITTGLVAALGLAAALLTATDQPAPPAAASGAAADGQLVEGASVAAPPGAGSLAVRERLPAPAESSSRPAEHGPLLLAGRVTGQLDGGSAALQLSAWPLLIAQCPPDNRWTEVRLGLEPATPPPAVTDERVAVKLLADGRFEVRGWSQAAHFRVSARIEQRRITEDYLRGTMDALINFEPVGEVEAVVLHDAGVSAREFEVRLWRRANEPPVQLRAGRFERAGTRRFEHPEVPAGTYTLEVRLHDDPAACVRIHGIEVLAGGACADPRLQRVDATGLCRRVRVRLLQPDGRPLALPAYVGAEVSARGPDGELLTRQPDLRQSQLEIVTPHAFVDLRVAIDRYQEVHLPMLRGDRDIYLEPRAAGQR